MESTLKSVDTAGRAPATVAAEAPAEYRLGSTGRFASPLRAGIMLLLEDAANAGLLSDCLREHGYRNLIVVEQVGHVRQMLLNDLPDLLLLDEDLSGDGNFDLLSWIRSEKLLKHTAVIVLSDSGDIARKLQALELGAADFLSKPVDARELALRMRYLLANSAGRASMAERDALTGLTNRQRFNIILDWALTYAKRTNVVGAVLQIGIDRFAQVNEALGPSVGDRLLQAVAQRLADYVRETDVVSSQADDQVGGDFGVSVSRIGGDEFTVLLPVIQRAEQAATVAMRIQYAMATPFNIAGHELIVTCSVGIAVFPADGMTRDLIVGNAGAAMAHAKQQGRDRHEFYGKEMNNRSLARLAMERDLRLALERNEFSLVFQPKVSVGSGAVMGAETLLRWRHPTRGMVSPAEFIPIAEELDLISPLSEWVFRNACRQIFEWKSQGIKVPRISINMSARQMHDPGFDTSVKRMLTECYIKGEDIMLELTESALMKDPDKAAVILKSLRQTGIGISIDDFGTGYSSLAYLRRFPLDELKIDRSFLIESNEDSHAIAAAIIALGHSLRLKVVAEGVEEADQLEFLRACGCDEYQGFYFSKPIPAEAFEILLRPDAAPRA
jgi:diguanylate cyclase